MPDAATEIVVSPDTTIDPRILYAPAGVLVRSCTLHDGRARVIRFDGLRAHCRIVETPPDNELIKLDVHILGLEAVAYGFESWLDVEFNPSFRLEVPRKYIHHIRRPA